MTLVNPKDQLAQAEGKVPLDLLEPAADKATAEALAFGAEKYGIRNYIGAPISARVYVAAMRRHLSAWLEGEDCASDSGVHHLGHVAANCHVALAAIEAGTFIDDRHGKSPATVAIGVDLGKPEDTSAVVVVEGSVLQREIRHVFLPERPCWDAPSEHAAALREAMEAPGV